MLILFGTFEWMIRTRGYEWLNRESLYSPNSPPAQLRQRHVLGLGGVFLGILIGTALPGTFYACSPDQ